jgi:hypothetical protein
MGDYCYVCDREVGFLDADAVRCDNCNVLVCEHCLPNLEEEGLLGDDRRCPSCGEVALPA